VPIAVQRTCIACAPPAGVNLWGSQPRRSGVVCAARAPGSAVGVARGGQDRDSGLSPTSTRRTVPKINSGACALAPILDGSTAGELIPEQVGLKVQSGLQLYPQQAPRWLKPNIKGQLMISLMTEKPDRLK